MRNTMYERLTKRDRYGHAYTNETIYDRGMTSEDGAHYEKHYFENGTSAYDGKPIDRLCDLEDKIEQGKIVELPCKVGQTVYHFSRDLGAVFPYFVENLNIGSMGKNKTYWNYEANYHDEETDELVDEIDFDLDDLGKTVFLSREDAEKALAERNENGK